ncbi:MAG: hypothetical protein A2114_02140 [Candidatus Vogelbacteria bacterium GWA1_51_14]|jgi:hypothetical protein|uniref:Uncharacterized protein n=1 Tax=Candidatus Vogelbacteria bacterium GWA1_51_14 TaxID=1802435 RepID=A0A1G2QAS8_9BACT|nr:MAG: hypothetical protein A2114_02140 [Candidatus Vogelbacteria bacterium GWA1_51_14]
MDPNLKRIEEKVGENQKILKKLLLHNRWLSFVSAVKWLVIIGAAFGAYYYFQPVIDQTLGLYKNIMTGAESLFPAN